MPLADYMSVDGYTSEQLQAWINIYQIEKRNQFLADMGIYWDDASKSYIQGKRSFNYSPAGHCILQHYYIGANQDFDWLVYHAPDARHPQNYWTIKEPELCNVLKRKLHLYRIRGVFRTESGQIDDDKVQAIISGVIEPFFDKGLGNITISVLKLLRAACYADPPAIDRHKIYFKGGVTVTVNDDGTMKSQKDPTAITLNRLPIKYNPDAPTPTVFIDYIKGLIPAQDILTVQQYLGYLLVPTTAMQQAMFIKGRGGDGKSQLLKVLEAIFGDSCTNVNLKDLQTNRFAASTLENMMLAFSSELSSETLPDSQAFKDLVTADNKLQVERKNKQRHNMRSYCRFVFLGNNFLETMHDNSWAFFRRQILLEAKPRPADAVDDKFFSEKMIPGELQGIVQWMLDGLRSLAENNYNIYLSESTKKRVSDAHLAHNPILQFLQDDEWVSFSEKAYCFREDFKDTFKKWCAHTHTNYKDMSYADITAVLSEYGVTECDTVRIGGEKKRGYKGIQLTERAKAGFGKIHF